MTQARVISVWAYDAEVDAFVPKVSVDYPLASCSEVGGGAAVAGQPVTVDISCANAVFAQIQQDPAITVVW